MRREGPQDGWEALVKWQPECVSEDGRGGVELANLFPKEIQYCVFEGG